MSCCSGLAKGVLGPGVAKGVLGCPEVWGCPGVSWGLGLAKGVLGVGAG